MTRRDSERPQNLRRIDDLGDLCSYLGEDLKHVGPVLKRYVNQHAGLHTHVGVRSGDLDGGVAYYCIWHQFWPFGRHLESDWPAIPERDAMLRLQGGREHQVQGPVLVVVRKPSEPHEGVIAGVPALVSVARLDEFAWPPFSRIHAGESGCQLVSEVSPLEVDWELDLVRFTRVGVFSMLDQLPGDVVEGRTVVVNGVAESSRKRIRRVGETAIKNEVEPDDRTNGSRFNIRLTLNAHGWPGVFLYEPTEFSIADAGVEIRACEFDAGALEGVTHAR